MAMIGRALAGVLALGATLLGAGFWAEPGRAGLRLGLQPTGPLGFATLRADMGGFFLAAAVFLGWAAATGERARLVTPLVLVGLALTARLFSLVVGGAGVDFALLVEATLLALILLGGWLLSPSASQKGGAA